MYPSKEEILSWMRQRVTSAVLGKLSKEIDNAKEELAVGNTIRDSSGTTALETARLVGKIEGMRWVLKQGEKDEG